VTVNVSTITFIWSSVEAMFSPQNAEFIYLFIYFFSHENIDLEITSPL